MGSSRLSESSSVYVEALVSISFFTDRDFLSEVLLLCATGLASSSSRLDGCCFLHLQGTNKFYVCIGVRDVQVVELAIFYDCCQPAATSSEGSHFLPFSVSLARHSPICP